MNISIPNRRRGSEVVIPIEGELLRFHVKRDEESSTGYLVDLQAFNGNGECGCPHFQYRLRKQLEAIGAYGHVARCKHIRRARSFFLDEVIRGLSKKLGEDGGI